MAEMNKPILIAIDHGYGNVKTPHFVFPTGITAYDEEPAVAAEKLCWVGRWYAIGDTHKEFIPDKTADEDYLKLTMVAIAKELNRRGLTEASVYLAVGLPLTWVGQQRNSFTRYLTQVRNLEFNYNGTDYSVEITGIEMNAQGFAAVIDRLKDFSGVNMLCDIGNGTMNIMYINNGVPVSSQCFTEKFGTNQCMIAAKEAVMRSLQLKVPEVTVESILRNGWSDEVDSSICEVIAQSAREYVDGIMRSLREHEYDPRVMRLWFMGGGACLVRNFGQMDSDRVRIIDDIQANAKGYQQFTAAMLKKRGIDFEE
ncbi:MAG: ParM/StbA family protein [Clostridia bacterium]|nr:ParM/StbA family protein [Clostridia bacterium]